MKSLFKYDEVAVSILDRILYHLSNEKKVASEFVYLKEMLSFDISLSNLEKQKLDEAITFLRENNYCLHVDDIDKEDEYLQILPKGEMRNNNGGILNNYFEFKHQSELLQQTRLATDSAMSSAKSAKISAQIALLTLIATIAFNAIVVIISNTCTP